jgi:hypothetical protein
VVIRRSAVTAQDGQSQIEQTRSAPARHLDARSEIAIVVSGQLDLSHLDLPPRARFLGEPLNAGEVIVETCDMIRYA